MATINIPTPLRPYAGGRSRAQFEGKTAFEVFQALLVSYPLLKQFLVNEKGELRSYVRLYLDKQDISESNLAGFAINGNEELHIIPAIAGGTQNL